MKKLRKFLLVLVLFSLVFSPLSSEQLYKVSETQLTKIELELKNSKENLLLSNQRIEELSKQLENSNLIMQKQSQDLRKQAKLLERSERSNKMWKTATFCTSSIMFGCLVATGMVLYSKYGVTQ